MDDSTEELEPLFDYTRVQPDPFDVVCLSDDEDSSPAFFPKRRKIPESAVEAKEKNEKVIEIIDSGEKEEEDWLLLPPPKILGNARKIVEDATIKQLRLKKQELISFAQSAQEVLQAVEESCNRDHIASTDSSAGSLSEHQSKSSQPSSERAKIVISIQDKDGAKPFRVYMDDKFERLFKMYAEKVKLDLQSLIFCFDGDKINPIATPHSLGMEDDDIIEVHTKSS